MATANQIQNPLTYDFLTIKLLGCFVDNAGISYFQIKQSQASAFTVLLLADKHLSVSSLLYR
jgi:hypothetical protein